MSSEDRISDLLMLKIYGEVFIDQRRQLKRVSAALGTLGIPGMSIMEEREGCIEFSLFGRVTRIVHAFQAGRTGMLSLQTEAGEYEFRVIEWVMVDGEGNLTRPNEALPFANLNCQLGILLARWLRAAAEMEHRDNPTTPRFPVVMHNGSTSS